MKPRTLVFLLFATVGISAAERYDEEMTVIAERLKPDEVPSPRYIVDTYNAEREGTRLYSDGRYKEALPHLLVAARRGFKWAQARVGDIYLHGRGGAPKSVDRGIAWLGVAATPKSTNAIRSYFKTVWAEVPPEHVPRLADLVETYEVRYGHGSHVDCELAGGEGNARSLRIKRLRCRFRHEAAVCRSIGPGLSTAEVDLAAGSRGETYTWEWNCPPIRGGRSTRTQP